jgi:hypothetical protein
MLPPERRLGRVLELIGDRKYFTLHSGRQTEKTTCAFWLVEHLNASGHHRAAWVDLQTAREQPDLERARPIILSELDRACARDLPSLARPAPEEQLQLAQETAWYVRADGSLDVDKLLHAFQDFWRRDGHLAAEGFGYREAGRT